MTVEAMDVIVLGPRGHGAAYTVSTLRIFPASQRHDVNGLQYLLLLMNE